MSKATINLETLSCPSCLQKIEAAVKKVEGVDGDSVKVQFNSSRVRLDFDEEVTQIETIEKAIEKMGYSVIKSRVKSA